MDDPNTKKLGCCCACICCFVFVILCVSGFSSLQPNEYGLDYSGISKTVNSDPYEAGLHFLGVGHQFYKYPKTVITIDFSEESNQPSIHSRTSDGLEV